MRIPKNTSLMIIGLVALFAVGVLIRPGYAGIGPEAIVGLWLFDEGKGEIAHDSSGNGHNGEFVDKAKWVEGKYEGGIELSGEDYIEVPHDERQNLPEFTIAGWAKFSAVNGVYGCIVTKGESTAPRAFGIAIQNTGFVRGALTIANARKDLNGAAQILDDIWHHVALTYDDEMMQIYVDGVPDKNMPVTGEPDAASVPIRIGRWGQAGHYPIGTIDEVAIFNIALTEEEINTIMTEGLKKALGVIAVGPSGKLAATWGRIKAQY